MSTRDLAALVVYDGDCAFCTTAINTLTAWFPGSFEAVPYQRADLASLGLTAAQCHDKLQWFVQREGEVVQRRDGARAVGALLRTGGRARGGITGAGARFAGTLAFVPPASWLAAGVYAVVAANRQRLPGGTPACALDQSQRL